MGLGKSKSTSITPATTCTPAVQTPAVAKEAQGDSDSAGTAEERAIKRGIRSTYTRYASTDDVGTGTVNKLGA